jgi:hypothetical protein
MKYKPKCDLRQRVQKAMQAVASQASLKAQQEDSCGTIMREKKGSHP